jgi:hypothetical protein
VFPEQSVKSRRTSKARASVGQSTPKPLGIRYAELLRLRQTIREIQSAKPARDDRRAWK